MTWSKLGLVAVIGAALSAAAGCKKPATPGPAAGVERGPCRPDSSCDPGLTCLSQLCVRPPPADCAKVAEQLSYLLLDNYAPRDQRDQFLAETRRQCEAEHLAERDGDCLIAARSRADLRDCPHPLGIGDCRKIEAHLESLRGSSGVDAYLVTPADRVVSRCKSEAPSLAFEQCALAARSLDDIERCAW